MATDVQYRVDLTDVIRPARNPSALPARLDYGTFPVPANAAHEPHAVPHPVAYQVDLSGVPDAPHSRIATTVLSYTAEVPSGTPPQPRGGPIRYGTGTLPAPDLVRTPPVSNRPRVVARPVIVDRPVVDRPVVESPVVESPVPVPASESDGRRSLVPWIAAAVVVLVLVAGGGFLLGQRGGSTASPSIPTQAPSATSSVPTTEPPTTEPPTPTTSPTPSPPASVTDPDQALTLDDAAASREIGQLAVIDLTTIGLEPGQWVPQVSSKCVGGPLDFGPDWYSEIPLDRSKHLTVQQVLGYQLAMAARYNAVITPQRSIGARNDVGTGTNCRGQTIWVSLVPQAFSSAAGANSWCASQQLSNNQCLPRLLAEPGSGDSKVGKAR